MTSDYGFSPGSVFTIQSLGKDWLRMRQHAPPYGKRQKSGHQDHDDHPAAEQDEQPPGSGAAGDQTAQKQEPEGFEIII
jgi:hypothetical protein